MNAELLKKAVNKLNEIRENEKIAKNIADYIEQEFNLSEQLKADLVEAVKEIKIEPPTINVSVPDINIPEIPIKIPEIKVPTPEVTVNVPEIKIPEISVPKPEVTVNVPEMKIPEQKTLLPDYDAGSVKYLLDPYGEEWTLTKNGNVVATLTLYYADSDRSELTSFKIQK